MQDAVDDEIVEMLLQHHVLTSVEGMHVEFPAVLRLATPSILCGSLQKLSVGGAMVDFEEAVRLLIMMSSLL